MESTLTVTGPVTVLSLPALSIDLNDNVLLPSGSVKVPLQFVAPIKSAQDVPSKENCTLSIPLLDVPRVSAAVPRISRFVFLCHSVRIVVGLIVGLILSYNTLRVR